VPPGDHLPAGFEELPLSRAWLEPSGTQFLGDALNAIPREHRHSAIRYVTPDERHYGREKDILARRQRLYERARQTNPERWTGAIRNWAPVQTVTLNPAGASEVTNP